MKIKGKLIDIHKRNVFQAEICFEKERIKKIIPCNDTPDLFIMPGLIDSHVHIESSMVTPASFARCAVRHGTIGVVSDPHEIANVMGLNGVDFMIDNAAESPLYFWFGAPSCVPATEFETSGSKLGVHEIEKLLKRDNIKYLSEMMNFPGVICNNPEVLSKLDVARRFHKPVDGHAPGITGIELKKYVKEGISTDHECSTLEEALEKISLGMKVLIREGSAARNLNSLKDLYRSNPEMIMLCSDDIHPEMLEKRHINKLIAILINEGYNMFDVIRSCTINPVKHYNLEAGLLNIGDFADFIIVDSLERMNVCETWIKGKNVFRNGRIVYTSKKCKSLNRFDTDPIKEEIIQVKREGKRIKIINAFDGELVTSVSEADIPQTDIVDPDPEKDILKIVVKSRYTNAVPAMAFIKGFNLKKGAFGSSVAHDSHNIICVGTDDRSIAKCINEIIKLKGGLAVSWDGKTKSLKLPVAGIMSDASVENVARKYENLSAIVKENGCSLHAPFMTLSFMALLVIPELKLSDRGLFDGKNFKFTSLFTE